MISILLKVEKHAVPRITENNQNIPPHELSCILWAYGEHWCFIIGFEGHFGFLYSITHAENHRGKLWLTKAVSKVVWNFRVKSPDVKTPQNYIKCLHSYLLWSFLWFLMSSAFRSTFDQVEQFCVMPFEHKIRAVCILMPSAKKWKQFKCPRVDKWQNLWSTDTIEYHSAIKWMKCHPLQQHGWNWRSLWSEGNKTQKEAGSPVSSLIRGT